MLTKRDIKQGMFRKVLCQELKIISLTTGNKNSSSSKEKIQDNEHKGGFCCLEM